MEIRKYDLVKRISDGITGCVYNTDIIYEDEDEYSLIYIRLNNGNTEKISIDDFYDTKDHCGQIQKKAEYEIITPLVYVNVYCRDREYGGPEEGGWWYNSEYPEEIIRCATEEEADKLYEEKVAEYEEENKDRRPISSVLSTGQYIVRQEAWPGEPYPKKKPTYC